MELKEIMLSEIILDKNTQPRAAIDDFIVNEYRLDMARGDEFPPLMVFSDNGKYYLADGWHRYLAAQQLQKPAILCAIKEGGLREATLYSCAANSDHGKRRTNGDKERAVKKLLGDPEWVNWSNGEIARQCRVSVTPVARLRLSLSFNDSERFYTTKHGTTAVMNTANIGKPKEEVKPSESITPDLFTTPLPEPSEPKYDSLNYRLFASSVDQLSQHIDANSIDAIITDPPYPKEYIYTYKELAEQAAIILKPSGILVALAGHNYIDILITQMKEYLEYQWLGCYYMPTGPHASLPWYNVSVYWKPLLIFCKGNWPKNKTFKDVFINEEADKEYHEWGQGISGFTKLIETFTLPNEQILDPFVGGGTTAIAALNAGRYFMGSDISEEEIQKTLRRINVQ